MTVAFGHSRRTTVTASVSAVALPHFCCFPCYLGRRRPAARCGRTVLHGDEIRGLPALEEVQGFELLGEAITAPVSSDRGRAPRDEGDDWFWISSSGEFSVESESSMGYYQIL
jgi:hypothetical protein